MKIHIRNIVEGAIHRGLIDGYLTTKTKLQNSPSNEEESQLLEEISATIWEELDDVIDFTEEEEEVDKTPVGFGAPTADAVSSDVLPAESEESYDEEERTRNSRRLLHKLRRRQKRNRQRFYK